MENSKSFTIQVKSEGKRVDSTDPTEGSLSIAVNNNEVVNIPVSDQNKKGLYITVFNENDGTCLNTKQFKVDANSQEVVSYIDNITKGRLCVIAVCGECPTSIVKENINSKNLGNKKYEKPLKTRKTQAHKDIRGRGANNSVAFSKYNQAHEDIRGKRANNSVTFSKYCQKIFGANKVTLLRKHNSWILIGYKETLLDKKVECFDINRYAYCEFKKQLSLEEHLADVKLILRKKAPKQVITHKVSLSEEYYSGDHKKPEISYRAIITLPFGTEEVKVWADEQIQIESQELNGESKKATIDNVKCATLKPNSFSKIMLVIEAHNITVPKLRLQADFMDKNELYHVFPDKEAHKKIAGFHVDKMSEAKDELGLKCEKDVIVNTQKGLQNLVTAIHHIDDKENYDYGVKQERKINPYKMDDLHWKLDYSGNNNNNNDVSYTSLTTDGAVSILRSMKPEIHRVTQSWGLFDNISHILDGITQIVVHTAKKVVQEVENAAEQVTHGIVDEVKEVAEEIETVIKVTFQYIEKGLKKAVQFVCDTVEHIGELVKIIWLFST